MRSDINVFQNFTVTADGVSATYKCYGYKKALCVLSLSTVTGTLPTLDIAFRGRSKAGQLVELNNFPTKTASDAGLTDYLEIDIDGFDSFNVYNDIGGTTPQFDTISLRVYLS